MLGRAVPGARCALSRTGQGAQHALRAAVPARTMGTIKEMMVRAAIEHVTSNLAQNEGRAGGAVGASGLQDADDVETWRAIVVRPRRRGLGGTFWHNLGPA